MKSADINCLLFNPVWTGKLLHYFLSGVSATPNEKIKFELIYFVLPLIYDEDILKKLHSCKKTSTFTTLFKDVSLKNCLINKDKQAVSFKEITNKALIYLANRSSLFISDNIYVSDNLDYKKESGEKRYYYKSAYYLGLILAKEDYKKLFFTIGVA